MTFCFFIKNIAASDVPKIFLLMENCVQPIFETNSIVYSKFSRE